MEILDKKKQEEKKKITLYQLCKKEQQVQQYLKNITDGKKLFYAMTGLGENMAFSVLTVMDKISDNLPVLGNLFAPSADIDTPMSEEAVTVAEVMIIKDTLFSNEYLDKTQIDKDINEIENNLSVAIKNAEKDPRFREMLGNFMTGKSKSPIKIGPGGLPIFEQEKSINISKSKRLSIHNNEKNEKIIGKTSVFVK